MRKTLVFADVHLQHFTNSNDWLTDSLGLQIRYPSPGHIWRNQTALMPRIVIQLSGKTG